MLIYLASSLLLLSLLLSFQQEGNVALKNYFRFKKRFIEAKIIPDSIITNEDFKSN